MPLTPLHLALGRDSSDLSISLFEEAVTEAVEETDALDWKAALPDKSKHSEFAKDVAAMANTGGGMLVYGVTEIGGTSSAAGALDGIPQWGDGDERRLRQIAYNAVQPPVHGLSFSAFERDGRYIVALSIPSSPDAPHLVWSGSAFTAPVRYGAQTEFMGERDLERSYEARFRGRSLFRDTVEERLKQLVARLPAAESVWLAAVAVPLQPQPEQVGRMSRSEAEAVFAGLAARNPFTTQGTRPGTTINPVPALRRWTSTRHRSSALQDVVEVHYDGVVGLAEHRLAPPSSGFLKNHVHAMNVQEFAAHLVWLIRLASRARGIDSLYAVRVTLHSDMKGLYIRSVDPYGFARDPEDVARIERFEPIDMTVDPTGSMVALLQDVRELATDLMNQGGSAEIGSVYLKESLTESP